MLKEFKEFVARTSVFAIAAGILIGLALEKVLSSFVSDIISPVIGLFLGSVDLSGLFIDLSGHSYPTLAAAKAAGAPALTYGVFLSTIFDFLIVALSIVWISHLANKLSSKSQRPAAAKDCSFCFTAIPLLARRCPHCTSLLI